MSARIFDTILIACIAWLVLIPVVATAHGGNYIITETRHDYQVVASLSPSPLAVGLGDISIAILNAETYQPALAEQIHVELRTPDGAVISYPATPELGPDQAIYGSHTLDFNESGTWNVDVIIVRQGIEERFSATVEVAGAALRWLNLVAYMVPLLALGLMIGLAALRNRIVQGQQNAEVES
jgi:hypothetical protein